MAVYAIGDLQGCYDEFRALLDRLKFDPDQDQLWLCGDLVSRGPRSLDCLRFVQSIEQSLISVLGNHDLHFLAVAEGLGSTRDKGLRALLEAPDANELITWLRNRPLLHYDPELDHCLVHAGIYPRWTLAEARQCANELEQVLRSNRYRDFFEQMYGDQPAIWSEQLDGWDRLRFICNAFTRMRFCKSDGALELSAKGTPDSPPPGCSPWFRFPQRVDPGTTILFGHWSTLGLRVEHNVHALDSGCVWGGKLTAYELGRPQNEHISLPCPEHCHPGTP